MAMPALICPQPTSPLRSTCLTSAVEREALRKRQRPQGRTATALLVRRRSACAAADGDGRRSEIAPPAFINVPPTPLRRRPAAALRRTPRQDVLEPDTRLRERLTPRPNPWSDGFPFVPDEDLVSLRVVHHGTSTSSGWASAGGCRYDDDACVTVLEAEPPRDDDGEGVPIATEAERDAGLPALPASWAVRGGPRDTVYFDPSAVRAAVVTVGGLCPGLNDVIRALVQGLHSYGVPEGNVLGIRYGFHGLVSLVDDDPCCGNHKDMPVPLTLDSVDTIHLSGGTVLGTSRGHSDVKRIVDAIAQLQLSMLYIIGGNGGNAAVDAINNECMNRGMAVAVVGLPKSIDNDLLLIDSCFGFATAVGEAVHAILAANVEARSMRHGVGLVKLMGRSSGFIAAQASIASGEVDVCLLPEVAFDLERVMAYIFARLRRRGFCTVVIAEGAAQDKMRAELAATGTALPAETDPSGNPVLLDAGKWLQAKIKAAAATLGAPLPAGAEVQHTDSGGSSKNGGVAYLGPVVPDVKYISPAYMIRSVQANTVDKVFCRMLGHSAVHGAFAGYSAFTAGLCSQHYVILPAAEVVRCTRRLDPRGRSYRMMRASLGQPEFS